MDGGVARRFLLGLAPWAGAIAIWYAVRWSGFVNASLIPAPHRVAAKFVELLLHEGLLFDIYASTRRVFLGVALGILVAVPVGFLLGWYRPVRGQLTAGQRLRAPDGLRPFVQGRVQPARGVRAVIGTRCHERDAIGLDRRGHRSTPDYGTLCARRALPVLTSHNGAQSHQTGE